MRERAAVTRALGVLGRRLEPPDRLLVVRLAIVDRAGTELELGMNGIPLWAFGGGFEPGEALLTGGERVRVSAQRLEPPGLLSSEARVEERRVRARQLASFLQGAERPVVGGEALAHVPERFEDAGDLCRRDVLELLRGDDRALEQLGGDDVRECGLRPLARRDGVRPCLLVGAGFEEME